MNLYESYLFDTVSRRVKAFREKNPERDVISLSIGDVTQPLVPAVVRAMEKAVKEMGEKSTFRGYGPEATCYAYPELLRAIQRHYSLRGVSLKEGEIFVSDGAKSDLGNLSDLFSKENVVLFPDPVYPAYADVNIMAGRRILYADALPENNFLPMPDGRRADIVYLCSPNNPTGAAYDRAQLRKWVDYAKEVNAVIFYDAAYEGFLGEKFPHTIYEIEGAKECAIEICSFSKFAGFTGVRCGYTIVPLELKSGNVFLNALFRRRQTTRFNGVSYVTQMGAAAAYSEEGEAECRENLLVYRENAKRIAETLDELKIPYTGGKNAPYLWLKSPLKGSSWDFFDFLLERAAVVGTPGSGFGKCGEGYLRLTAFGSPERTEEACQRLKLVL